MLYESMLLFAVVFIFGWLFSMAMEQRHALYLRHALATWLFLVIGIYFIWFWTHSGQTLAMKTWRVRLLTVDGKDIGVKRALVRYLLGWLWVLPGLALAWGVGARGWMLALIPAANLVAWALTAFLDPRRQFLHDRIAGTQVVSVVAPVNQRRK